MRTAIDLGIVLLLAVAESSAAGDSASSDSLAAPPPTAREANVSAGIQYQAGPIARTVLGRGWRGVWTARSSVPVFHMADFAGGVEPTERGGGNQTTSLRFREATGWREYHFRSVNKDPVTLAMPAAIRGTMVGHIVQDMTSTLFPAAGLMVPPLLDAIDVLHVTPALYVMPDDPGLGEFRKSFAGMLGTVELSPQEAPNDEPGFANSRRVASGEDFLDEVIGSSHENHLDEREFFAARLVDFLINDNDRTADNIRFARFGEKGDYRWRPVPRDRDRAFTDARGWLARFVVRPAYPKLVEFGPRFSLDGLTFESTPLDRRLLQGLTREDTEQIARRVQLALDDATLDEAIAQAPPEWRKQSEDRLRRVLRARRDGLTAFAGEFYEWLATDVDVHGTDEIDRALIIRHDDGSVTVTVTGEEDSSSVEPFSRRTFLPDETGEIRLYLHDGDDSAVVRGASNGAIKVRVIGGEGSDALADSAGGQATRFYDTKVGDGFFASGGTSISLDRWDEPRRGSGVRVDAPWRPDWGSNFRWGPTADFGHGSGVIVGFGPRFTSHGFRRLPHRWRASANALGGLGNQLPGVNADVDYRTENSPLGLTFVARATRFEEFRFHGYGNDAAKVDRSLSQVEQDLVAIEPSLVWRIGWRDRENFSSGFGDDARVLPGVRPLVGRLEAGPILLWNDPAPPPGSPLAGDDISGGRSFGRVGTRIGLSLDRTSSGPVSEKGWRANADLATYPRIWDVESAFSTAAVMIATYIPLPGEGVHLAMRAGGETASGGYPVQHAPAIGGRRTVRGLSYHRYRGDTSASGSTEVRVPIGTVPLLIKWDVGVFGLADAGRVWFDGRSDGGWHTGVGAGLWFTSLGFSWSLAYAHGDEDSFYLRKGLSF